MKIVILGASGTGKSSLCKKFVALSQRQSSSGMYPTGKSLFTHEKPLRNHTVYLKRKISFSLYYLLI